MDLLPTLPEILSRANYQTQLCGKLHLWPYRKNYGFENMVLQDGPGFGPEDDGDYLAFLRDHGVEGAFPQMAGCHPG